MNIFRKYIYIHGIVNSKINEPLCGKTNKKTCVASEDSDQTESLLCAQWVVKGPRYLHADREDSLIRLDGCLG